MNVVAYNTANPGERGGENLELSPSHPANLMSEMTQMARGEVSPASVVCLGPDGPKVDSDGCNLGKPLFNFPL